MKGIFTYVFSLFVNILLFASILSFFIVVNAVVERSEFLEKLGFPQSEEKKYLQSCPKMREICEVNKKLTLEDLPKLGDKN